MVAMEPKKVIGLMTGTSCDSIDAALCEVQPDLSCKLIRGINFSYPESVRAAIFRCFEGVATTEEICRLNFEVGKCFADAANVLISEFGKPDLIASHGQTIWHVPGVATLQTGESSVIAQETGCLTVSNFREADIAAGGQGAPLVCFADEKWFKNALVAPVQSKIASLFHSNGAVERLGLSSQPSCLSALSARLTHKKRRGGPRQLNCDINA